MPVGQTDRQYYRLLYASLLGGHPRVGNGAIHKVQYQLEVNRCRNEKNIVKGNVGWAVGNGAIHINRCRNEDIIVKGNFGWAWPMWAGRPRVVNGVQYQFEVNRCRNEEIIVKGNFGWAWPMWVGRPRINRIVIREVQYQFEAILDGLGLCGRGFPALVMGPCIVEIDRIVIREVQYQFADNLCRNEEIIFQGSKKGLLIVRRRKTRTGRTDRRTAEITTISPGFSKSMGIII
ncbi:hypothetical protein DPMN_123821 [Dreissena polymorpha]|uniref:Uncharacterized protein n=1 Tax=Dreissena polymorpha TaxID=45954 RepID=A0A9D4JVP7_DREPO|nr:hypothetical protein DPMN_123821 [Dreissena polymorpha]